MTLLVRPSTGTHWFDMTLAGISVGPSWDGRVDSPTAGATVNGIVEVSGSAVERSGKYTILAIEISVNNVRIDNARGCPPRSGKLAGK